MNCSQCGSPNDDAARFCGKCGAPLGAPAATQRGTAPPPPAAATPAAPSVAAKNPTVALVISIFLGAFGGGQFYNGDWKKGLAMLGGTIVLGVPTAGLVPFGVWIWSMFDAYQVAGGKGKAW
jgi:TM2 domain-containing membrane protein YozV